MKEIEPGTVYYERERAGNWPPAIQRMEFPEGEPVLRPYCAQLGPDVVEVRTYQRVWLSGRRVMYEAV